MTTVFEIKGVLEGPAWKRYDWWLEELFGDFGLEGSIRRARAGDTEFVYYHAAGRAEAIERLALSIATNGAKHRKG